VKQLLLATNNRYKIIELRALLADVPAELLTIERFPQVTLPAEDKDTLEGNAVKKAEEVYRQTRIPTLADDSGLEVEYLNNAPGVYSSRYAGPGATYADNCKKLLRELGGLPPRRRGARFRCVIAFVTGDGGVETAEGDCIGSIIEKARGANGFGYDPIFVPSGQPLTLAEMDSGLKNKLSHRGKAIQNIQPTLLKSFS
jgi:XTP/dITP diphosphohydrolase